MSARIINAKFEFALPVWKPKMAPDLPQVCFAGRSNVGKSSLINALVEQRGLAKTSSTPGRTQSLVTFTAAIRRESVDVPFVMVDLPGYGFAKVPLEIKNSWRHMAQSYFNNNPWLVCCLFLIDIRRTPGDEDIELAEMLGEMQIPLIPIITKSDKVPKTKQAGELKRIAQKLGIGDWRELYPVSVLKKQGIEEVRDTLFEYLAEVTREKEEGEEEEE